MSNQVLINQMLQLFCMMLLGYFLFKVKRLTKEFDSMLIRLILDVTMPLMIIGSVMQQTGEKDYFSVGVVFLVSALAQVLLAGVGMAVAKICRFPGRQQGMYSFMMAFSNVGFMGIPIINALYGNSALLYTAVFNLVFNVLAYSMGILLMQYKNDTVTGSVNDSENSSVNDSANDSEKDSLWRNMKGQLMSPGFLGSLFAILLYFLPLRYPAVLSETVSKVGGITSPLAMLVMGATLAEMPVREVFSDWRVYLFACIRQLLVPLLAWPLLCRILKDEYMRGVIFILIMMPVANTVVLFSNRYGADEKLAAKNVFISTALALLTVPLCAGIVGLGF